MVGPHSESIGATPMTATIKLGYEVGTGKPVYIPGDRHIGITGQTQRSGKTTTIEGIISRSSGCALAFICKRGESSFRMQSAQVPPFFQDPLKIADPELAPWQYVVAILEAKTKTPMFIHRRFIMHLCEAHANKYKYGPALTAKERRAGKKREQTVIPGWERPKSLRDVYENASKAIAQEASDFGKGMYYELQQFLKITLPEIESIQRANEKGLIARARQFINPKNDPLSVHIGELHLAPGLNVMDIHKFSEDTQSLIIAAAMREIYRHGRQVKIILPEAQRFWPQTQKTLTTPVAQFGERIAREGAVLGNLIYLDSQDMAGVAKVMLRQVTVWLFGVQGEHNEIKRVLQMIPDAGDGALPDRSDIMTLKKGEFFVRYDGRLIKTYVQPGWMGDLDAQAIATGDQDVEVAGDIERRKFGRAPKSGTVETDSVGDFVSGVGLVGIHPVSEDSGIPFTPPVENKKAEIPYADLDEENESDDAEENMEITGATGGDEPAVFPVKTRDDLYLIGMKKYEEMCETIRCLTNEVVDLRAQLAARHPDASALEVDHAKSEHGVHLPAHPELQCEHCHIAFASQELVDMHWDAVHRPDASLDPPPRIGRSAAGNGIQVKTKTNGDWHNFDSAQLDELYFEMKRRAMNDQPGILELMSTRPELHISIEKKVLPVDEDSLQGRVAMLIHDGYFAVPRPGTQVQKEIERRGGGKQPTTNLYTACDKLAKLGFLTKEEGRYLAVAGFQVQKVEA
jgi:hypothetical protein